MEEAHSTSESAVSGQYDDSTTPPSLAILKVISVLENVPPEELDQTLGMTLHEAIDPGALNSLFTEGSDTTVSFDLAGYYVEVDDERVTVRKAGETISD